MLLLLLLLLLLLYLLLLLGLEVLIIGSKRLLRPQLLRLLSDRPK